MLVYKMKEYKSLLCKRAIYVTRAFYRAIKCFIILSRVESTRYVYRVYNKLTCPSYQTPKSEHSVWGVI